jgi:xanthine dehydrogenase accessory factor
MDGWDVLEYARELFARGEAFVLATVVWRRGPSSGKQGYRAVVTTSGRVHGWIGGACAEPIVVREARHALTEGVPRLIFLGTPDELEAAAHREGMFFLPMSCQSEGALEIYIEPIEPKPHVVVIGRSPMAETLVQLAQAIGWRSVLVDADGGSAADHPMAERVVSGLDLKEAGVDARSFVVVATQGHHDEEAVEQTLLAGLPMSAWWAPGSELPRCWDTSPTAGCRRMCSTGSRCRLALISERCRTARSRWESWRNS